MSVGLFEIVTALRPDVTWQGGMVNDYSIETLKRTYQSAEGFPGDVAINQMRDQLERGIALDDLKNRIIAKRQEMNSADFNYDGTLYVSDEQNIQGVRLRIDGLSDSEPIPTFVGTELASTWRSAEDTFVAFNCGEFRSFSEAYYNHRERNFTRYTVLTIAAITAHANGATIEELNDFDISQGWD